jgi:hypothetical protein
VKCACGKDASVFENGRVECTECYLRRVRK